MAEYLQLLENPRGWFGQRGRHSKAARKGRRSRNVVGYDEFGNPITVGGYSYYKPSIGKRVRVGAYRKRLPGERNVMSSFMKNPAVALPATMREWTQGITPGDIVSGSLGLAGSLLVPGYIIKEADTTGKKFGKMCIAIGMALGVGAAAKAFIGPSAGKAAVIGGIAGVVAQGVEMVTGRSILGGGRRLLTSPRRMGVSNIVSPSFTREGETVSLITP